MGTKHDSGKPRVDLIPPEVINAMSIVMSYGANKYADRDWESGLAWGRIFGALQRHLWAFWGGEDLDKESGLPHLYHAATNMAFLVAYFDRNKGKDDRK